MNDVIPQRAESELRIAIERSNQDPIPRSIVLSVNVDAQRAEYMLEHLYREIELVSPLLARDRTIVKAQFSAGAMSALSAQRRNELWRSLAQHFSLARDVLTLVEKAAAPNARMPSKDCDLLGLGIAGISRFGITRSMNAADPDIYCAALDARHLPVVFCEQLVDE